MASIAIGLMGFDVANAPIIVLELALNQEVGLCRCRQINIAARVVRIKADPEILIIKLADRDVFRTSAG